MICAENCSGGRKISLLSDSEPLGEKGNTDNLTSRREKREGSNTVPLRRRSTEASFEIFENAFSNSRIVFIR